MRKASRSLAYALGAAVIVAPLAILLAVLGSNAVDSAQDAVDTALGA